MDSGERVEMEGRERRFGGWENGRGRQRKGKG